MIKISFFVLLISLYVQNLAATPKISLTKGWEKVTSQGGVEVFSRDVKGSSLVAFRGVATIDAPIEKVATVLYVDKYKKQWVHRLKEGKVLRVINERERIEYNHTKTPWPLTDRDFVFKVSASVDRMKKSMSVSIHSIKDQSMPKKPSLVRGEILESFYKLKPMGKNKTSIEVVIQADPKGMVPKFLVNLFQKKWPINTLNGIRKLAKGPNFKAHPKVVKMLR